MSSVLRIWAIGLSLLLVVVGGAAGDAPKVTVEVHPTSVELPAEGSTEAALVVRNPTELTAKQVQVKHTDLAGVTVEIEPTTSQTIPSNGASAWILKIDFGAEIGMKQSSAQIKELYQAEDLLGKQVICVLNFPPKQIGPVRSECLVTGLYRTDGRVVLAVPDREVQKGARLG